LDNESPYRITERREFLQILHDALRQLKPEYAELIALKYEQDLTVDEIAEITDLPAGTIKSSLHRARNELAEALRRRGLSTLR
jgi:RNA polymerase sigma-70 factor (ECF subfamily)